MGSIKPLTIFTGKTILKRWGIDEKQLIMILNNDQLRHAYKQDLIEPYEFESGANFIASMIEEEGGRVFPLSDDVFSADDVHKLEADFPKLVNGDWKKDVISVKELEESWGYDGKEIVTILSNCQVYPVDPTGQKMDRYVITLITENYGAVDESDWLYLRSKVVEVERKYSIKPKSSTLKKETHVRQCKQKCREIAKLKWEENPEITIKEMIEDPDIRDVAKKKNAKPYGKGAVRGWIADLCPDRSPGRRPQKK